MEVVTYDEVDGQVPLLVLASDLEQFFLGLISQLTLPESQSIFWHDGYTAGDTRVGADDVSRGISRDDPVVECVCGVCLEGCGEGAEDSSAYGRIVPQEAVTEARKSKGHSGLRISLRKFKICTLQIEERLLVLAHAVYALLWVLRLEPHSEVVVGRAETWLPLTSLDAQGAALGVQNIESVAGELFEENLTRLNVGDDNLAATGNVRLDLAIGDGGRVAFDGDIQLG